MAITKVSDFSISDFPADTTFLLDTNVLYFVHSGYYMPTNPKSQIYSNLLQQLLSNGRKIVLSALNIQELLYGNMSYICRQHIKAVKYAQKKVIAGTPQNELNYFLK